MNPVTTNATRPTSIATSADSSRKRMNGQLVLLVAGLGSLLYGIDVGIIVCLVSVGILFLKTEKLSVDGRDAV